MELSSHDIAGLKASGQSLSVAFQIGKNGVTEGVVAELKTWLEREPLVKVKLLRSSHEDADPKALAQDLAQRAGVILVEVRGHTALFYRGKRRPSRRRASD